MSKLHQQRQSTHASPASPVHSVGASATASVSPPPLQLQTQRPIQRDDDDDNNSSFVRRMMGRFNLGNFGLRLNPGGSPGAQGPMLTPPQASPPWMNPVTPRPPMPSLIDMSGTDTRPRTMRDELNMTRPPEANSTLRLGSRERNFSLRRDFMNNSSRFNLNYDGFNAGMGIDRNGEPNRFNAGYQGNRFGFEGNVNPMTGAFGLGANLRNIPMFNNRLMLEQLGGSLNYNPSDSRIQNNPSIAAMLNARFRF